MCYSSQAVDLHLYLLVIDDQIPVVLSEIMDVSLVYMRRGMQIFSDEI